MSDRYSRSTNRAYDDDCSSSSRPSSSRYDDAYSSSRPSSSSIARANPILSQHNPYQSSYDDDYPRSSTSRNRYDDYPSSSTSGTLPTLSRTGYASSRSRLDDLPSRTRSSRRDSYMDDYPSSSQPTLSRTAYGSSRSTVDRLDDGLSSYRSGRTTYAPSDYSTRPGRYGSPGPTVPGTGPGESTFSIQPRTRDARSYTPDSPTRLPIRYGTGDYSSGGSTSGRRYSYDRGDDNPPFY